MNTLNNIIILSFCILFAFWENDVHAQYNEDRLIRSARRQLVSNEFTQAIVGFNRILKYNPENSDAYLLRGIAKYELSDNTGAELDFRKAYELDTFRTNALYYLALLSLERDKLDQAMNQLNKAISLDDRHARYFVTRGWIHAEFTDTVSAVQDFNKAITLDPKLSMAYINLSYIQQGQKEYVKALENCNKAIKLNPEQLNWYLTRGHIFHQQKEFEKAREEYAYVINQDSLNLRAYYFMGLSYAEEENFVAAIEQFDKVIDGNSGNASALYYRALAHYQLEQFQLAILDLDAVVKLNKENIYAYYARGLTYHATEQFTKAEADFTRIIKLLPELPEAYRIRASIRFKMNDLTGYLNDKSIGDTLIAQGAADFSSEDLRYLKQVTSFRNDFIPVSSVSQSKIQYAENEADFLDVFVFACKYKDTDFVSPDRYRVIKDLKRIFSDPVLPVLVLKDEIESQETASQGYIDPELYLKYSNSPAYDTIIKCMVLSLQHKYQESNQLIAAYHKTNQPDYLLYFIQANNYQALAGII